MLPFTVMSNDPEQEFFADGLVEDILTTLSKLSGLSVIARNSSFAYKGRAVDVRQVARELGVRYVLEGSVRKAGNRIRITAQLIDAATGIHIWADRYDRGIDDIFAVQDEITLTLATEMQVRLTEGEQARLRYTTTSNVAAWNFWIEGLRYVRGPVTGANQILARRAWEKALALDPDSAPLNALLGFAHFADARFGWWDDRETALAKAQAYVDRALAIDPENPDAHRTIGGIRLMRGDFDGAIAAVRRAVELGPNLPDVLVFASFVLQCSGRPAEAIALIEKAMTLSPNYPPNYLGQLGNAYRLAGRSEEALAAFRAYHAREPRLRPRRHRDAAGAGGADRGGARDGGGADGGAARFHRVVVANDAGPPRRRAAGRRPRLAARRGLAGVSAPIICQSASPSPRPAPPRRMPARPPRR